MDFFDNKTVWITGASSGIGEALAQQLSLRGAHLILSARNTGELERVRQSTATPERHRVFPLDVSQPEQLAAKTAELLQQTDKIDVLINNAGISQRALANETDLEVDRRIMEVNYFGTIALSKAVLPAMIERGSGQIVAVSSLAGIFGTPLRSAYAASKHALHGFFDSLRTEVHGDNILITLICPGFVRTNVSLNALTGTGAPQGTMDNAQEAGMAADVFAQKMLRAIENQQEEAVIAGREKIAVMLKRLAPRLLSYVMRRIDVV